MLRVGLLGWGSHVGVRVGSCGGGGIGCGCAPADCVCSKSCALLALPTVTERVDSAGGELVATLLGMGACPHRGTAGAGSELAEAKLGHAVVGGLLGVRRGGAGPLCTCARAPVVSGAYSSVRGVVHGG